MSELADRLEALKNRATEHIAKDEYQTAQILNFEMATMVWQQCEAIIKALRFAADMERLKIREIRGPRYSGDVWTIFHLRGGRHLMTEGPGIYTAARNAVEALEKGESDGK